jgi:serpin B
MRSRWACVAAILLLLPEALAGGKEPISRQGAIVKLARSSNAFAFDLYQRLRRKPGNLVVSPASITTALTMPWGGARGETAAQMRKVLHLDGTADEVMTTSGRLSLLLQSPVRPVVFRIANGLFVEKSCQLAPAYLQMIRRAFGAPAESLDFKQAPDRSRLRINQWVESKTEHHITDLIPPSGVGTDARLVLANAIYFRGRWEIPFEPEMTSPEPFHLTASRTKDVPTMHYSGFFRVAQKDGVTALAIPYKQGQFSMVFLVPDKIEGLAAVEEALGEKKLVALISTLKPESVDLALPKFEVNPDASLSLGEDLKALGMPLAFDRAKADFTGIATFSNPADRLVLAKVFHKAFVRVDEEGTEAAAATTLRIAEPLGLDIEPPRVLKVDRPFLFLIRDNASGLILFLGRVSDPSRR